MLSSGVVKDKGDKSCPTSMHHRATHRMYQVVGSSSTNYRKHRSHSCFHDPRQSLRLQSPVKDLKRTQAQEPRLKLAQEPFLCRLGPQALTGNSLPDSGPQQYFAGAPPLEIQKSMKDADPRFCKTNSFRTVSDHCIWLVAAVISPESLSGRGSGKPACLLSNADRKELPQHFGNVWWKRQSPATVLSQFGHSLLLVACNRVITCVGRFQQVR